MDPFKGAQRWPASDVFEVEENNRHGGHPHGYSPPAKIQIFPKLRARLELRKIMDTQ